MFTSELSGEERLSAGRAPAEGWRDLIDTGTDTRTARTHARKLRSQASMPAGRGRLGPRAQWSQLPGESWASHTEAEPATPCIALHSVQPLQHCMADANAKEIRGGIVSNVRNSI
ncbi:unnamed protein product [Arctogadus glacialis]